MTAMKFYCVSMGHESNAFSPIPTSLDSYREDLLFLPSRGIGMDLPDRFADGDNIGGFSKKLGYDVVCGLIAFTQPSLPMGKADFEILRDEIITNLKAAMPVDAVVMFLHGAQMAAGYDDCEGEIVAEVRKLVGPDVPITVEIDLHGNITRQMIDNIDILMACKEYPHTDFGDRAEEMVALTDRMVKGEISPCTGYARVPMFGSYFTTREPMRSFVDEIMAMEGQNGILTISLGHGFPWADSPEAGACVVVVKDGDRAGAQQLAEDLAARFFSMRDQIILPGVSLDQAIAQAEDVMAQEAATGPVVIADVSDNPGGGAACDSTFFLQALLDRGIRDVAIAMIWDPVAVNIAQKAGVGALLPMRIGGKSGPKSGQPVDVMAKVLCISDSAVQKGETPADPLGLSAAIEVNGIQVILNSQRQQTYTPECFTELGIDPYKKKLLIVKSHQHFYAAFAPFASKIIYAEAQGTLLADYKNTAFTRIMRPVWPIDQTPFVSFGKEWGKE